MNKPDRPGLTFLWSRERTELRLAETATLLFLGVPFLFFAFTWLKFYLAMVLLLCLFYALGSFRIRLPEKLPWKKILAWYSVAIGIALLHGFGEIFMQYWDWPKHKAVFSEIFNHPTGPVKLEYKNGEYILCYGLGYYMVPSILARLAGPSYLIPYINLFNTSFGIFLCMIWIRRIWKLPLGWIIAVFFLGNFLWIDHLLRELPRLGYYEYFRMIRFTDYTELLDQAPQHFLPAVLLFFPLYDRWQSHRRIDVRLAMFLFTTGIFWTPFIVLSAFFFALFALLSGAELLIDKRWLPWLVTAIPLSFILWYYSLHIYETNLQVKDFPDSFAGGVTMITEIILLYGIGMAVMYFGNRKWLHWKHGYLPLACLLTFFLFDYFNYGFFNELYLKGTIIPYFLIRIYIAAAASHMLPKKPLLVSVFLLGAMYTPVSNNLVRWSKGLSTNRPFVRFELSGGKRYSLDFIMSFYNKRRGTDFMNQYLGRKDPVAMKYIFRNSP